MTLIALPPCVTFSMTGCLRNIIRTTFGHNINKCSVGRPTQLVFYPISTESPTASTSLLIMSSFFSSTWFQSRYVVDKYSPPFLGLNQSSSYKLMWTKVDRPLQYSNPIRRLNQLRKVGDPKHINYINEGLVKS